MFKWIGKIKQLFKKKQAPISTITNGDSDAVYVDLGASSIKMSYKGKFITFRSSVRQATDEEKQAPISTITNGDSDAVYVDLGASSIKMSYKGKFITFRSSVRQATDEEVTFQENKILVDGKWYIIGESATPTGNYKFKYMKENLHVLVLYGLKLLGFNREDAHLHVLLPYNELHTTKELNAKAIWIEATWI